MSIVCTEEKKGFLFSSLPSLSPFLHLGAGCRAWKPCHLSSVWHLSHFMLVL